MAIIKINKNIFSNESQEKEVEEGKTIEECLCYFNKPVFTKGKVEVYDCDTGETTYAEISDDDDYLNAVIVVNGEDKGLDYIIKENDIVSVTFYPGNGDSQTVWKNIGLAVGGVALIVAGIAISVASYGSLSGVGLQLALMGAGLVTGIGIGAAALSVGGFVSGEFLPETIWNMLTKKLNDGSNESGKSLKQIPNVRNAKNETIIGNTIPMVMGTQQVAPFITGSPFYEVSGDRGTIQYITILYCVGYSLLKLTDFKLGNIYLARNQTVSSGTHDTVMHGILRGYSDTTGDIEDKWRYNDVSLEILQKGDDYGTLYNKKIIAESINSYVLHIYDTALSNIQYGGIELASGYRTNTVKFTQSCPYEISVELYLGSGFNRTRSESSNGNSKVVYGTMPCWVAIQYRFYKNDTETYNSAEYYKGDATYDGGWKDFTSINNGFINLSDYTATDRDEETPYHTGDSIDSNYNDGWINGKAFNLSALEDGHGSGLTQIRLVASHTFTVEECAEIAGIIKDGNGNKYADLTTLQVRVVRLSPQYCAQESSESSSVGTWSYVESVKWNYLTSKCFDRDKLSDYYKTNGSLPSSIDNYVLRPCNSTNLDNGCYVALKVKSDSTGEIAGELDKFSVTAESLAPKYNDTDKTWYPEIVTNTKKYYGAPVYNTSLGKYEMGAEITKEQYIADRQSGIKSIEYDAGSNMVTQMKDEIFSSSTSIVPLSFIFTGHISNTEDNNIYIYNNYSKITITKSLTGGYQYRGLCYDGTYIYAAAYQGNTVSVIDKSSFSVKKIISVGNNPQRCNYDGTYVYVSNINSDNVSVINPKTLTVIKTIGVGNGPVEMYSKNGLLYVSNEGDTTVSIIDKNSLSIINNLSIGTKPSCMCHDGTYLYVANWFYTPQYLRVYDASYTLIYSLPVNKFLCMIVDGNYIYAVGYGNITKLSTGAVPSIIASIDIGGATGLTGICFDDYNLYVSGEGYLRTIDKNTFTIISNTGGSAYSGQCCIIPDYKPSVYILPDELNTKYVTNNPASMFLLATCGILLKRESLEYYSQNKDSSGNIAVGDINMQSCTESYKFCEDVTDGSIYDENDAEYVSGGDNVRHMKFGCNAYIYNPTKLDDILSNICICARGVYTIDSIMRLTMVIDKPNDCSAGIINQSNCIESSNSISFADMPSGYKINYPNEDDGYQGDVLYAMDDGENYTNPLKEIVDLTLKYVTNTYQSWSLARYFLGCSKINKEVITRTVGAQGYSAMIGDVMDVQDLNILIGTDHGGHIQSLIEDADYIYGFICDNVFEYTGETDTGGLCKQGVKILQSSQWQSSRVISIRMATTEGIIETDGTVVVPTVGITNQVVFSVKIVKDTGKPYDDSASIITYLPEIGDIVAFGEVDEITSKYKISKITHSDKNQFQLFLVTYNENLYNYGAKLPSYNSHLNKPKSIDDISNLDFTVTQKDIEKSSSNASNMAVTSVTSIVITASSGVIIRSADDSLNPATVTFSAHIKLYDSTLLDYSGRFIIAESTDGITYSQTYESTDDESSHEYTPSSSALLIKATLYASGGVTVLYDSETVGIVSNQSGYTAWIENDTLTFSSDFAGSISSEQTEHSIIKAYKGTALKAFTVGTITPVSGLTVSNDSGTLTIVSATGTSMADNGTITIPITYTDDSFQMNLVIRYTKIKTGATGESGATVALTSDNSVFSYNQSGTTPSPASGTLAATLYNYSGTAYYEFVVDGVTVQNNTSYTYAYTAKSSYVDMPDNIIVKVHSGSSSGTIIASDSIDMIGIKDANDGANGTRTASIEMYKWSASSPTTYPVGTSTYTWETGEFTNPATLNGWSQSIGIGTGGQVLYRVRSVYADTSTTATSSITWPISPILETVSNYALDGSDGVNGTRTAILEVYKWASSTPTSFPSGTSTYTWSTGVFTAPTSANGWSISPGASTAGYTLYACQIKYADALTTETSTVTWSTSTAYAVGAAGNNGMTYTQQNASQSVPADSTGTVTSYTGTGNIIRVFEGSTELQAVTGTPLAGQYKVIASGTDIIAGGISISGLTSIIGVSSSMTTGTSTLGATVTYTITGVRANGTAFSTTLTQSITKAIAGVNLGGNIIVADPTSTTPEAGMEFNKIYYNLNNGSTYRWSWEDETTGEWTQINAQVPSNPIAYYTGDDVLELPKDESIATYLKNKNFTTVDGWTPSTGVALTVESGKLKAVGTVAGTNNIYKTNSAYQNKHVRIIINCASELHNVYTVTGSSVLTPMLFSKLSDNRYVVDIYWSRTGSDTLTIWPDYGLGTTLTWYVEAIFIGYGDIGFPCLDRAAGKYNANNFSAMRVVCDAYSAIVCNGVNSGLIIPSFTQPSVMTVMIDACDIKSRNESQAFFCIGANLVLISRLGASAGSDILRVRTYNGTATVNTDFSGFFNDSETSIIVTIDATNGEIKTYRNGKYFDNATGLTIVPQSGYAYVGKESTNTIGFYGHMLNCLIFDRGIDESMATGHYLRLLPEQKYRLADYRIDSSVTAYSITANNTVFTKTRAGVVSPSTITVNAKAIINETTQTYNGRFIIYTYDKASDTWTSQYTSSSNESSHTYTIPAGISGLRVELYKAGGITTLVGTPLSFDVQYAADVAPQYLNIGILSATSTKSFVGATVADDGTITPGGTVSNIIPSDWMVNYSGTVTTGIYYWSGAEWVTTTDSKYTSDGTIQDIMRLNKGGVVLDAWTSYANLIATNLFSHKIKIIDLNDELGCIYGGDRFNADGTIADRSKNGYYLSNDGKIKGNLQSDDLANTIIGTAAGLNIIKSTGDNGSENVIIGYGAGFSMDSGYYNCYLGVQAGFNNISGYFGTSVGYKAGYSDTGFGNCNYGANSGYSIGAGYYNCNYGANSGHSIGGGHYNCNYGAFSYNNGTGVGNCNYGYQSGINLTTGDYNLCMGNTTSVYKPTWDYQMNLGNRIIYLEFASTATQDTVYKAFAHYIIYDAGNVTYVGTMGRFGASGVLEVFNDGDNNIDFKDNNATVILTCISGSSTQIGHPLQVAFIAPSTPTNI